MTAEFPFPDRVAERDRAFWSAAAEGTLLIQECTDCGHRQFYPRPGCEACGSGDLEWFETEGIGEGYSHTVIRRATEHPALEDDLPYVVAYVELEEGPLFCTNIVGCAIDDVENGMEVEVTFDRIDGELSVPKFRPR